MHKIVITNRAFPATIDMLSRHGRVVVNEEEEPWPAARLREELADATGLMAFMTDRVDDGLLARAPRLRVVACALKGYDNFDVDACSRRGIWLTVVPDLLTEPTAELAIGLMIGVGRQFIAADRFMRSGAFAGWRPRFYGVGIKGSAVAILGMGAVGQAIAERLRAFGASLSYWDNQRLAPEREAALDLRWSDLAALVRGADFLVLALPLNGGTFHLIGRDALAAMKPGAILVNPSRGSVVDEAAVAEALESGRLGGYAADTFESEDWARTGRPGHIDQRLLADTVRTLFTPHLGSAVMKARLAIEAEAATSIIEALSGRAPHGAVNIPGVPAGA